jgi:hypothetical protein
VAEPVGGVPELGVEVVEEGLFGGGDVLGHGTRFRLWLSG